MEEKHPLFETTVLGVLVLLFAWPTFFVFEPKSAVFVADSFREAFLGGSGASESIARWIALGVAVSVLGTMVQVFTTVCFQDRHGKDEGRRALAERIRANIREAAVPPALRNKLGRCPADPLFVWVHYSDHREHLIQWGRTRRWYVYLGENWHMAMIIGLAMGAVSGTFVCIFRDVSSPADARWQVAIIIAIAVALSYSCLKALRTHNEAEGDAMVAMYAAGRLDDNLEKTFLPKKAATQSNETNPTE